MTNTIELRTSFEEYVVNELVNKLHELNPEDYDINNVQNYDDLLDLLLEDEIINGCYYIYTSDDEKVFKEYFSDILFICDSFGYADGEPIQLEAGRLLLVAMEHAFTALLESTATHIKFTRAGLDEIANRISSLDHGDLVQLINFD